VTDPQAPEAIHKIRPVQPTGPCMLHTGPWLVEDGCPSQDLCLVSA
jgi:hypothetical protein